MVQKSDWRVLSISDDAVVPKSTWTCRPEMKNDPKQTNLASGFDKCLPATSICNKNFVICYANKARVGGFYLGERFKVRPKQTNQQTLKI